MNNDSKRSLLERFYDFMERDTRAVEVVTYGIAGAGLIAAMYKIKPISKFQRATDVPFRFLVNKVNLQGSVTRVEMNNGATIYVDHKPLIKLPRFGKQIDLPIKIEGVDVNMNGFSWLQTVVVGKTVNFIPVRKERDILGCIISMPQQNKEPLHIGEELVKLGFGTVRDIESETLDAKLKQSYQHSLESAQKSAKRKRNGVWHFKIPPTLMWKIQSQISNQMNSVLPSFVAKRLSL